MKPEYVDLRKQAAEKERKRQKALDRQKAKRINNVVLVTKEIDKLSNKA